jgi:hypothetical protein
VLHREGSVLDPKLDVVKDPTVAPDKCALYKDVSKQLTGAPKLLYSSCRVLGRVESSTLTKLNLGGPLRTKGVARIYTGGKAVASVEPANAKVEANGGTALVTIDNQPKGVDVTIHWR